MTKIIINISTTRPKPISCFTKYFIEELFEKFPINTDFWNISNLDMYLYNKNKFFDYIKDYKYNNPKNNINTNIIKNWRTNINLINYIIERKKNSIIDTEKLFEDINGELDEFKIITLDDEYDYDILYFDNNREYIQEKINYKEILYDLKKMIIDKIELYDINTYFRLSNNNKYTKKFMEDIINCSKGECFDCYDGNICYKNNYIDNYDFKGDTYY